MISVSVMSVRAIVTSAALMGTVFVISNTRRQSVNETLRAHPEQQDDADLVNCVYTVFQTLRCTCAHSRTFCPFFSNRVIVSNTGGASAGQHRPLGGFVGVCRRGDRG